MKQVIIQNIWNINSYNVNFTLSITLYPCNATINELPITNQEKLNAFKIAYYFQDLEKIVINIKDIKITSTNTLINDNYDFNCYCSFFDNAKINCKDISNQTFTNITTLYITMYIENVFKVSERPTKKIKHSLTPKPIIPSKLSAFNQISSTSPSTESHTPIKQPILLKAHTNQQEIVSIQ